MAEFSSSDIIEAKRRVEEMRKKSLNYVPDAANNTSFEKDEKDDGKDFHGKGQYDNPLLYLVSGIFSEGNCEKGDFSKVLTLVILLLLLKEGADNSLIIALLYILL